MHTHTHTRYQQHCTMSSTLCLLLAVLVATTTAELTDECLYCMCYASSNGCVMPDPTCRNDGWGELCGPWAITEPYWEDGGHLLGDYYKCTKDWECNEKTVRHYMEKYVKDPTATCEKYARTHVGGPWGSDADYTLEYWWEVEDCLDHGLYTRPTTTTPHRTTTAPTNEGY
ncbi:lysozyme-like [Panulirus ornatus]|uniref:lysozyme-like n=1 Tax=Panulirus ornatus TaxID=150431 RepID=UPI003A884550